MYTNPLLVFPCVCEINCLNTKCAIVQRQCILHTFYNSRLEHNAIKARARVFYAFVFFVFTVLTTHSTHLPSIATGIATGITASHLGDMSLDSKGRICVWHKCMIRILWKEAQVAYHTLLSTWD